MGKTTIRPETPPARTVALDILGHVSAAPPVARAGSGPEPRSRQSALRMADPDASPFNPYKILNHFDKLKKIAAGQNVFPVTVEIDPSNRCNHRCQWCVSAESHTGEKMHFDRFSRLAGELKKLGTESIVLKGGGEPTLHPRINDMLYAAREAGLRVGMITNGSMPFADTRRALLECADWVRISIDAANADTHHQIHGSADFGKILDHISDLAANAGRTMIGMNFVAEQRNHDQILEFARLAERLGVTYVTIRCVFDSSHPLTPQMRRIMRDQAAAAARLSHDGFRVLLGNFTDDYLDADHDQPFPYRKCLGPNLVGIIGADGEVYACCFLRGNKQFSFGNVQDQTFEQIWNGQKRVDVMEAIYRGECGHVCMGGMTANRYNVYNQILNYLTLENKEHTEFV